MEHLADSWPQADVANPRASGSLWSLRGFKDFWQQSKDIVVLAVDAPRNEAYVRYSSAIYSRSVTWSRVSITFLRSPTAPDCEHPYSDPGKLESGGWDLVQWGADSVSLDDAELPEALALRSQYPGLKDDLFYRCGVYSPRIVIIPVKYTRVHFPGRDSLIKLASQNNKPWEWRNYGFEESFPQLAEITKDYQNLDLESIRHVLASEAKRSGESFEALGIKFPANGTARWGSVLVLGVLAYFWIHLHEISPKLKDTDPGWDVAWIGVYSSAYAVIGILVTLCILPATAAAFLAHRAYKIDRFTQGMWAWVILCGIAIESLGIFSWLAVPGVKLLLAREKRGSSHVAQGTPDA